MATHDYNLANQSGASFRSDLNDALQAVLTNNSSASAPSTTASYMFWADTNTGILKIRNSSNDAWVELLQLDGTLTLEDGSASAVALGFRDELNTGIFSSGSSNFDVSIAGTTRLNISATGLNVTGTVTDDGATHDGDVTFTGASANVVFDKSDNALEFADNAKATFGTGADLSISHDGTDSKITNITGNLIFEAKASETAIKVIPDGAVELYHNNVKKLGTDSGGVVLEDDLFISDSNFIYVGNGLDLSISHDGSHSRIIDSGTGHLIIQTSEINIMNAAGNEDMIKAAENGAVELFFDNSKVLETVSGGINITGILTSTGQVRGTGTQSLPSLSFADNTDAGFYTPSDNNIGVVIDGDEKYEFGLGNFIPSDDDSRDLGQASFRWDDVRATNGTINTSDKNEKNTITATDLGLDFVNKLTPVSYKFNNKTRTHYGLIAQDIETVLGTISKSATDFAGFCKDTITEDADGNALDTPFDRYGLRYTEFIAPIIKAIQELSAKVTALEGS